MTWAQRVGTVVRTKCGSIVPSFSIGSAMYVVHNISRLPPNRFQVVQLPSTPSIRIGSSKIISRDANSPSSSCSSDCCRFRSSSCLANLSLRSLLSESSSLICSLSRRSSSLAAKIACSSSARLCASSAYLSVIYEQRVHLTYSSLSLLT
jgi:hypothetical protein